MYELWHGCDVQEDSAAQLAALIHSTHSQVGNTNKLHSIMLMLLNKQPVKLLVSIIFAHDFMCSNVESPTVENKENRKWLKIYVGQAVFSIA